MKHEAHIRHKRAGLRDFVGKKASKACTSSSQQKGARGLPFPFRPQNVYRINDFCIVYQNMVFWSIEKGVKTIKHFNLASRKFFIERWIFEVCKFQRSLDVYAGGSFYFLNMPEFYSVKDLLEGGSFFNPFFLKSVRGRGRGHYANCTIKRASLIRQR